MDSNNSSSTRIRKYDVFLSFRGTDTRNTFTDHLYHHLIRKGIFVFKDDQSLHKGESISPQLLHAIQDSRVSIVVFSKDYAASSWCLEEMAAIADCRKQLKQTVIPIFYDVDPSHVRKQNGVFAEAFLSHLHGRSEQSQLKLFGVTISHTEKFKGKVDQWKIAMTELGNLAGFDVRDK